MHIAPIFLLACNLLDSQPEPAPVPDAPAPEAVEPIATPEPCPHGAQVHAWLGKRYPNIPEAAYTAVWDWDSRTCAVEVPEYKQLYRLTCTAEGCEEGQ